MTTPSPLESALPPLILIVDNQPAVLEALAESLNSRNFRTTVALDGQQGLHYASLLRPDLVLLDIALPGMDSNEVCRSLKANRETCAIPVIFMVEPDDNDKLLAGFEAGGIDFLIKPLQIEDVIARLNLRLKLHGLQQAKANDTGLTKCCNPSGICDIECCEEVIERKRAEQLVIEQKGQICFMSFVLDRLHEAIFLVDSQAGFRFRYVNDKACHSLGYTRDELLNMCVPDINPCVDLSAAQKIDAQMRQQAFARMETILRSKNGCLFPVEISWTEIEYEGQTMGLSIVRDITERKHMEAEVQNHLRFFESMDRVNRAIQGSNDLETVMTDVLDTVLSIFDCDRVYIVYPCDPEADSWRVPMECTRPEYPGALALGISVAMDEDMAAAFRVLLDSDSPVTAGPGNRRPLPKAVSEQFGFKSQMEMAVYPKSDKPWIFGMHQCSRARAWTADEKKLFQEISRRLTDGLTSLLAYRDIQESEQKFRNLAESLPDYISRYDLQTRKTYANPMLEQLLGKSAEAWLGKTPKQLNPGGELDEYQAKIESTIRTGKSDDMELKIPDGNNGWRYHHIHFAPERGPNGEIIGALAIGRDVTKQRQLELELIRSERDFRTLAENLPDAIIRYDRNFRKTYVNQAYEISRNTKQADVIGKTPLETWHLAAPSADEYIEILRRVMASGKNERIETHLSDADGNPHFFSMQLVPEYNEHDKLSGVLTVATDITELKNAERQLREFSSHLLSVREEEKAGIAREIHDNLGGMLTALKMDINWLIEELSATEKATSPLKHIESMSQLLDNATLAARQVITDLRPTILDDFGLSAALEWQAEQFRKRTGIQCRVVCDESYPCELDKTQTINLFRIFQESLTNVVRHSGASKVEVELQYKNAAFILTISDNGCGLPEGHIISPASYGMLGMRERTEQLGGRINFYSPPDGGFSIKVMLPQPTDDKKERRRNHDTYPGR
jgi:PAS domain S-box-containing protein